MPSFLKRFFPSVLRKKEEAKRDEYCVYDSQVLTAFTSSLYIAGLVASIMAGRVTRTIGRQMTMILGGATFLGGSVINAAAVNVEMLILGRILLGLGVGFTNQVGHTNGHYLIVTVQFTPGPLQMNDPANRAHLMNEQ